MGQKVAAIKPNCVDVFNPKNLTVACFDRIAEAQCFYGHIAK